MPGTGGKRPDRWWTWRWDRSRIEEVMVPHIRITRWRRGSFLTIYKMETNHNTQWWFYGPFNLAVGFSYPTDQCMEDRRPKADESGAVPRARVPGDQKYWN